jgi:hypothetical protein
VIGDLATLGREAAGATRKPRTYERLLEETAEAVHSSLLPLPLVSRQLFVDSAGLRCHRGRLDGRQLGQERPRVLVAGSEGIVEAGAELVGWGVDRSVLVVQGREVNGIAPGVARRSASGPGRR